jgi:hypothetical protein
VHVRSRRLFLGWQGRYCILDNGILTISSSSGTDGSESFNIKGATFVGNSHATASNRSGNPTVQTQFDIHFPDQTIIYFRTNSEPLVVQKSNLTFRIRQCWLDCLNAHQAKLHECLSHSFSCLVAALSHTHRERLLSGPYRTHVSRTGPAELSGPTSRANAAGITHLLPVRI